MCVAGRDKGSNASAIQAVITRYEYCQGERCSVGVRMGGTQTVSKKRGCVTSSTASIEREG